MKRRLTRNLLLVLIFIFILSGNTYANNYNIVFGGVGPGVPSFELRTPLSTYAVVTSSWNQPRDIGTNPHNGVDLRASLGTDVYSVCDGWITEQNDTSTYHLVFVCDVNGNKVNDDDLQIYYDHLETVNFKSNSIYITKGTKIAESGDEDGKYAPHLHFGARASRDGKKVWIRNEPYYRWTSNWNYGRDLDFIKLVTWNYNVVSVDAYGYSSGNKISLNSSAVTLFHRKEGTTSWSSVTMTKSGDTYTYDLSTLYSNSDIVHWMVRAHRTGLGTDYVAFMIPKYQKPPTDPNATTNKYDYYRCTIGGGCTAVVTP